MLLMGSYGVSRKVAVIAARYMRGIDTIEDVTMTLVRRNPITREDETSMTEWFQFCDVCKAEHFDVTEPERKIEKDGRKFVFAS